MSKFVQKTLHSLNTVLNSSGLFYSEKDKLLNTRRLNIAAFQETIRNVCTKQEEEEFVNKYLSRMEKRLSEPDVSCAEVEELVKICMVCEAMDYRTDFIYVHSLKLAQKGNFQQKHMGYLAAEFFLHPHHELVILLINTIQKDLQSSNHMEVVLALTAVCHLIDIETVHNVLHLIESKLQHPIASVRKCAVLTLSHCLDLLDSDSARQMTLPKLEKCLGDSELEVVSVVVSALQKVIKKLPGDFSYLLDSLLQLLEQILMRRIPHSMIYSDIPAPWLQVEILKLIRHLCTTAESSKKITPVLKKTLAQSGSYHTVAQAIVYQVLDTIACVDVDAELLEVGLSTVSTLLKSRDVNMKFMGLEALIMIVKKAKPNITATQQDIIIDCLKLHDQSLQLKTLELMHHLANSANVQAITKKMIEFLDQIKGSNKKRDLAEKILQLAEIYKNRSEWYVSVVLTVLMKVDNLMTSTDICKILTVIMQDDELKRLVRLHIGKHLRENDCALSSFIKIYVSMSSEPSDLNVLLPVLEEGKEDSVAWILISLMESILKHKSISDECLVALKKLNNKFKYSYSLEILIHQMLQIVQNIVHLPEMGPYGKVDPSLSYMDSYVIESLMHSSNLYEPPSLRLSTDKASPDFNNKTFCVVQETNSLNCSSSFNLKSPAYTTFSSPSMSSLYSLSSEADTLSPNLRKKAVWSKEGRAKKQQTEEDAHEKVKEEELVQLFAGLS